MKTIKKLIYSKFCSHSRNGVSHLIFDLDMKDHMKASPEFTLIMEVELPMPSSEEIVESGVASIDAEISEINAVTYKKIERLKEKKQQLLAITYDNGDL